MTKDLTVSYDVVVFEPEAPMRDRATFLAWFTTRTQWGVRANDPTNATPRLQAWFHEMIETFPPLNTPNRPSMADVDAWERAIDYVFAEDMIYIAISGGRAVIAYQTVSRLAAKYGVGVYDVSDDGDVWFPTAEGGLEVVFHSVG
jgi:hypothetical protein